MGAADHDKAPRRDQNSFRHGPRQGDFLRPWRENTALHLQRGHHTQSLSLLLHGLQRASTEDPPHKYTGVNRPLIHMGHISPNIIRVQIQYKTWTAIMLAKVWSFFLLLQGMTVTLHVQENKSNIYLLVPFLMNNMKQIVLKYLIWVTSKKFSLWDLKV